MNRTKESKEIQARFLGPAWTGFGSAWRNLARGVTASAVRSWRASRRGWTKPVAGDGSALGVAKLQKVAPSALKSLARLSTLHGSIRGRQAAHDELDLVVGELPPRFDLGHVGGLGKALEPFARLGARLEPGQAKRLAPPGRVRSPSVAALGDALGHINRILPLDRHGGPSAREVNHRLARFRAHWESGIAARPSLFGDDAREAGHRLEIVEVHAVAHVLFR